MLNSRRRQSEQSAFHFRLVISLSDCWRVRLKPPSRSNELRIEFTGIIPSNQPALWGGVLQMRNHAGVGRGCGVGRGLGVALGAGVADGVAVLV